MTTQEIIEQNKKSIILVDVQIPAEGNQKKVRIKGTGFIISSDGKFITNAHVYKAIAENEMEYAGVSVPGKTDENGATFYDRYKIRLLGEIDTENDTALMQIISEKNDFPIVKLSKESENLKEGEEANGWFGSPTPRYRTEHL